MRYIYHIMHIYIGEYVCLFVCLLHMQPVAVFIMRDFRVVYNSFMQIFRAWQKMAQHKYAEIKTSAIFI